MKVKIVLCMVLLVSVVFSIPIAFAAADTSFVPGKVYLIKSDTTNYYVSTRGATNEGAYLYVDTAKAGNYRVGYDPKQLWYTESLIASAWPLISQGAHMEVSSSCRLDKDYGELLYEVPAVGVGNDGVRLYTTLFRYLNYDSSTLRLTFPVMSQDEAQIWYLMPAYSLNYPTTNYGTSYLASGTFTGFSEGQCTWYVAGRVQEKLGIDLTFTIQSGNNAGLWYDRICNPGIIRVNEPMENTIAVFGSASTAGHVVFIEYVEDGYVYFSEANYGSSNNNDFDIGQDGILKRQTISQFENRSPINDFIGYIYLGAVYDE